ncbi:MAG: AI-2E family transporter [Candidatus Paceibacterota bacterium]
MDITTIRINSGTIIRVILFLALAYLLYEILDIILVVLAGVVIASAIEPAIRFCGRHHIPRIPAVIGMYVFGALAVFAGVYFFLPPIIEDLTNIISQAPEYIRTLQLESTFLSESGTLSVSEILNNLRDVALQGGEDVISFVSSIFGGIISFFLILTLAFYLSIREGGIEQFIRLISPSAHEDYVSDLWHRSQRKIGLWLQGQFIVMFLVGLLVYIGLTIIGVPNALLLGILAGLFEIIPFVGPILAAIPIVGFAALSGGLSLALMATGLFIIVQQIENNFLSPVVVNKVVGVPPIIVILAVVIGGSLAGFLGILLAVPLAAALMEFAHDVDSVKHNERQDRLDETV